MMNIPITQGHVGPAIVWCDPDQVRLMVIEQAVAAAWRLKSWELHDRGRPERIVLPRQVAQYLGCRMAFSVRGIARYWQCQRCTVYYSAREIQIRMDVDLRLRAQVERLAAQLEGK